MLSVQNVSLARGGLALVSGLTFDVTGGQVVIVRGRNGAGKTTLLRAVAGLGHIDQGDITCAQDPAFSGHADALKPALTVAENLAFWVQIYGQCDVAAAVDAWDLAPLLDRAVSTLSAGQRRRAGLARLVVTGRKLWLMDEPTTALDADFVARFEQVLRGHIAQGGAALLSTHSALDVPATTVNLDDYLAPQTAPDTDAWAGVL
ncbi:MAG: heme ABC exporter ATP-binding protein CcmA [Pseudomonadota bacterium]